ncbi:type IVB secretion system protein IcmH/DotU [Pseudoalteromonas piscicida]|uniref:type IVB secretion system protein IcmH/DotU n=1 Tax=Pseudoalteromonas piscicida TaxID=43662 RepID=UPI00273A4656|nr:type IVB secretion system protein IcmH/DotU [Pseudoalteromonas piscicida]MDP4487074.1 type IVB secretion system protein IcmH/DotU [Pseudoalteromonas piscicida]
MEASKKKSELVACISPVLEVLTSIRQGGADHQGVDGLRSKVMDAFDEYEKSCYDARISASEMQEAKFALTALVDEQIMTAQKPYSMEWMARPLQLELFGNMRAGEAFFEKLENIRRAAAQQRTVLEVYFVCLQLGFEGIYKIKGVEQLKALMLDVRAQLEELAGPAKLQLSDNAKPQESMVTKVGRNLPYWVILSVTLALLASMYVGSTYFIENRANQQVVQIDKHIEVLTQLEKTGKAR